MKDSGLILKEPLMLDCIISNPESFPAEEDWKPNMRKSTSEMIKLGPVVQIICLMWVKRSVPVTAGAKFVVSERGDILSPKYAPEITAPAVIPADMLKAVPTAIKAIPTVAEVVYELPVVIDTIDVTSNVSGKNIDGLNKFNP